MDKHDVQTSDFMIVVKPHLDKKNKWTGEVTLKMVVDKANKLDDDDFYSKYESSWSSSGFELIKNQFLQNGMVGLMMNSTDESKLINEFNLDLVVLVS